jgi:pimeloyl-ACP methyl ester carboxylesterase
MAMRDHARHIYEEISAGIVASLQCCVAGVKMHMQTILLDRGIENEIACGIIDFACLACIACSTVLATSCLGSLAGFALGVAIGFMFGACCALMTLGLSIIIFPSIGAAIGCIVGAAGGFFIGARLLALWLESCMLYHPRRYSKELPSEGVKVLTAGQLYVLHKIEFNVPRYCSADTVQAAFLLEPEKQDVTELWVAFGGNAMLALDWLPFCENLLQRLDKGRRPDCGIAFLLIDYPGYGVNPGATTPLSVGKASQSAIRAALARFKKSSPSVNILGHSLGASAAVQLAVHLADDGSTPGRLLLSAPFVSIPDMALHLAGACLQQVDAWVADLRLMMPEPLQKVSQCLHLLPPMLRAYAWLPRAILHLVVPHRWDNVNLVKSAAKASWHISIIHGIDDCLVPVSMGHQLYCHAGQFAEFVEVPSAAHNDVLLAGLPHYIRLMGLGI